METYLNVGNEGFKTSLRSQIYVDKTGLIEYTNNVIGTEQKYVCVSRPRRFGKTMALKMLAAYYGLNGNSEELFEGLEIKNSPSFKEHLNKYNVIFLNIHDFLTEADSTEEMLDYLQKEVINALRNKYPNVIDENETLLSRALKSIYNHTNIGFVFLIDEWDCIFRIEKNNTEAQTKYLDFLRNLLKDKLYVSLVYMTGILPVKKYGLHSALNMFDEYSMIDQGSLERFTGFTEEEVFNLCQKYDIDFKEMQRWYNGYVLKKYHIYNPKSVVDSIRRDNFGNYWTSTETFEALRIYMDLNYDGLKDSIIEMLGGTHCKINTLRFQNNMTTFQTKDDVLTLLVHLGYLAYDLKTKEVFIPNEEIRTEYVNSIEASNWNEVIKALSSSEKLLEDILKGNEESVAAGIDKVHMDTTSILNYNNENLLSCTLSLAFYSARNDYMI